MVAITSDVVKGQTHNHPNFILDSETGKKLKTYKIFSRGDVAGFGDLLNARANGQQPLNQTYDKVVSSDGIYTLRFNGNDDQIPDLSAIDSELDANENGKEDTFEAYELYQLGFGTDGGFLMFMIRKFPIQLLQIIIDFIKLLI